MREHLCVAILALTFLICSTLAHAGRVGGALGALADDESTSAVSRDDQEPLTISVEPLLMYMTPGGRFILPGEVRGGRDIDVEMLNVDSPRMSPGLRLDVTYGNWIAAVSGFTFTTDRKALSPVARSIGDLDLTIGQPIRTQFTFTTAEAYIGHRLVGGSASQKEGEAPVLHAGIDFFTGARAYWIDVELANPQGTASADPFFIEPIIGLNLTGTALDRFSARVRTSFGYFKRGDDGSHSFQIESDLTAQIMPGCSAIAGYRLLVFDLDEGDVVDKFEYRGSMAGLYVGLKFEF